MGEQHRKSNADRHPEKLGVYLRLDPDQMERLKREAEERDVTVAWMVRRLVAEGLTRLIPAELMFVTR